MKKFYQRFCWLEETICCCGFLFMIGLVFLSAVARTTGHPLSWSIDISQLLLCWTTLIGADVAFRKKKILGLDLFTKKLPVPVQRALGIFLDLVIQVALLIFIYYGTNLSIASWKRSFQTLKLSYSYVTMALPVMSVLMSISVIIDIAGRVKGFRAPAGENGEEVRK